MMQLVPPPPPLPLVEPDTLQRIAADLAQTGLSIERDLLPAPALHDLRALLDARSQEGAFRQARVGVGPNKRLIPELRSDTVSWLDEDDPHPAIQRWLATLDALREAINEATFMGLFRWEGHLTLYPPGSFYRKHLDIFRDARERKVSTILYLNPDWSPEHGGALRVYPDGEQHLDIPPLAGTFVTFLSEHLHHEVLTAHALRASITGWLRVRDLP